MADRASSEPEGICQRTGRAGLLSALSTGRGTVHAGAAGQQGGQQNPSNELVYRTIVHALETLSRTQRSSRAAGKGPVALGYWDLLKLRTFGRADRIRIELALAVDPSRGEPRWQRCLFVTWG